MIEGRVAFVTGASRGIGAAAARRLAEAGATVALAARSRDAIDDLAGALRADGHRASSHALDVSDWRAAAETVRAILDIWGRIDILVNNAGVIQPIAPMGQVAPPDWARTIEIDLMGVYNVVHPVLPHMLAQGHGTIVTISSGAAHRVREGWSSYCAAKAGLVMVTRSLHVEHAGRGIRAFGFQPGVVDTEMQAEIRASSVDNIIRALPRSALASPDEPARAIVFLCTPAADPWVGAEFAISDPEFRTAADLPARG